MSVRCKMDRSSNLFETARIATVYVTTGRIDARIGLLKSMEVIIGGVLLVPPSPNGGWECAKDEDFWDAYEKYELKDIDEEGFYRIKRYEAWEYENITKRICNSGIPMWNGILCGIHPDYASKGWGKMSYSNCLRLVQRVTDVKLKQGSQCVEISSEKLIRRLSCLFKTSDTDVENEVSGLLVKLLHGLSMLSHRAPIIPNLSSQRLEEKLLKPFTEESRSLRDPVIFAISHSVQAARFHERNGFSTIVKLPYRNGDCEETFPMSVTAMVMQLSNDRTVKPRPRVIPCITSSASDANIRDEKGIDKSQLFRDDTALSQSVISLV